MERVNPEVIETIHRRLSGLRVFLSVDPEVGDLRAMFATIRGNRNKVVRLMSFLIPINGRLRSALVRAEHVIDQSTAKAIATNDGFLGCRTERQKLARIKGVILSEEYETKSAIEEDLALVGDALSHARLILEEHRAAFEEASRSLASRDFEWRVERGAP